MTTTMVYCADSLLPACALRVVHQLKVYCIIQYVGLCWFLMQLAIQYSFLTKLFLSRNTSQRLGIPCKDASIVACSR